jgi:hypothetical protein
LGNKSRLLSPQIYQKQNIPKIQTIDPSNLTLNELKLSAKDFKIYRRVNLVEKKKPPVNTSNPSLTNACKLYIREFTPNNSKRDKIFNSLVVKPSEPKGAKKLKPNSDLNIRHTFAKRKTSHQNRELNSDLTTKLILNGDLEDRVRIV